MAVCWTRTYLLRAPAAEKQRVASNERYLRDERRSLLFSINCSTESQPITTVLTARDIT
jgi:hypothetical protein